MADTPHAPPALRPLCLELGTGGFYFIQEKWYTCTCHATRGDSGSLWPAIRYSGVESPPEGRLFRVCPRVRRVDTLVSRNRQLRIVSGLDGSSTKEFALCAVRVLGESAGSWVTLRDTGSREGAWPY